MTISVTSHATVWSPPAVGERDGLAFWVILRGLGYSRELHMLKFPLFGCLKIIL